MGSEPVLTGFPETGSRWGPAEGRRLLVVEGGDEEPSPAQPPAGSLPALAWFSTRYRRPQKRRVGRDPGLVRSFCCGSTRAHAHARAHAAGGIHTTGRGGQTCRVQKQRKQAKTGGWERFWHNMGAGHKEALRNLWGHAGVPLQRSEPSSRPSHSSTGLLLTSPQPAPESPGGEAS